jgi:hypothetical protein
LAGMTDKFAPSPEDALGYDVFSIYLSLGYF